MPSKRLGDSGSSEPEHCRGTTSQFNREKSGVSQPCLTVVFLVTCLLMFCGGRQGNEGKSLQEVVLRGRVICVDKAGTQVSCRRDDRRFALRVADGRTFEFLQDDPNSMMFDDHRIRKRTLQVRGWRRGGNSLEIIKVHSLKDDQLFDIHYFCQTCNIKAFVGGLCWCCQEEFELREVSVDR